MTSKLTVLAAAVVFCAACTKGENAGSGTGTGSTPSGGATSSTTTVPIASSVATADPGPTPTASASAAPTPSASAATKQKDAGAAATNTKPASTRITGNNFALDVASPGCKVDTECPMTIKLAAQGDWHLNKEYPYKFLASAAPNITFLGKGDATTFSKQSGDFAEEGAKSGTMTIRFKPQKAGDATVSGTYKLSVCSADQCQIEQAKVSLTIPVM